MDETRTTHLVHCTLPSACVRQGVAEPAAERHDEVCVVGDEDAVAELDSSIGKPVAPVLGRLEEARLSGSQAANFLDVCLQAGEDGHGRQ